MQVVHSHTFSGSGAGGRAPRLEATDLHLWRGDRHVLRGVSLAVDAGDVLQLVGANGAGKTTLLRALAGLSLRESGQVHWNGRSIDDDRDGYVADLAWLGHEPGLKADLTVRENLLFATRLRRQVDSGAVAAAIDRVALSAQADLPVRALSAGQRRRAALARLLLAAAPLWLLDEPYTNLDAAGARLVESLLATHAGQGGLAVVATHQSLSLTAGRLLRLELA